MALVNVGGGGGRAGADTDDSYALDKPYDLAGGDINADTLQKMDEMFSILFKALVRGKSAQDAANALIAALSGGTGNVTGPATATDGDVALFNGGTGKIIKDGGTFASLALTNGLLQSATLNVSNAQLNVLNGTPLTIIGAPGANKIIVPVLFSMTVKKTVASATTTNIRTRYAGIATDVTTAVVADLANARHIFISSGNPFPLFTTSTVANLSNKALEVSASAAGPFTSSDATLEITVSYYITACTYP